MSYPAAAGEEGFFFDSLSTLNSVLALYSYTEIPLSSESADSAWHTKSPQKGMQGTHLEKINNLSSIYLTHLPLIAKDDPSLICYEAYWLPLSISSERLAA